MAAISSRATAALVVGEAGCWAVTPFLLFNPAAPFELVDVEEEDPECEEGGEEETHN
jgi:hypothetical protein